MDDRDYDEDAFDKQWASKYILGPLYDPEPSQVCATRVSRALPPTPPADSPTRSFPFRHSRSNSRSQAKEGGNNNDDDDPDAQPFLRRMLSRSNSVNNKALPPSPPRPKQRPLSELERKRSVHTSKPPQTRWNQGTILARANSVASSRPSASVAGRYSGDKPRRFPEAPVQSSYGFREGSAALPRRGGSLKERYPGDMSHRPLDMLTRDHKAKQGDAPLPRRGGSLRERYPGDMSHRPLDMLKREYRIADRASHLSSPHHQQPSDTIDSLDHTGPVPTATYHHDGPFDPTTKARNVKPKYSPVDAVQDTNMEALKATPAAYLRDVLDKHVPLQGTAVIPPGEQDMTGRVMDYEEGADLMREKDAAGGAYKRWDHVPYLDQDLKGKGEPSYTLEREEKDRKARQALKKPMQSSSSTSAEAYKMRPITTSRGKRNDEAYSRPRSMTDSDNPPPPPPKDYTTGARIRSTDGSLQRSNTTGRHLVDSIRRRIGSLRRRKTATERVY